MVKKLANHVKISCLGPTPYAIDAAQSNEQAVNLMIDHWKRQMDNVLPNCPDVIVVPEVCDRPLKSGFPTDRRFDYYRYRKSTIRDAFAQIANDNNCYITYPAHMEQEDGSWRNSMQLLDRSGQVIGDYHKNHLVPNEYNENGILYGKEASLIQCDFGTVAPVICFDLNFEDLRLQYAAAKPDLILFSSMYHGGLMQKYWAYSCRSHFAGAIAGLPCTVLNPVGDIVASSTNYYPFMTTTVNLDCAVIHIDENHVHFRDMKHKYGKDLIIHDPGFLGPVLISSESDEFTALDVVADFELELLDDYFNRALAHRCAPGHMEL
jgi:predicted amidohydrolase